MVAKVDPDQRLPQANLRKKTNTLPQTTKCTCPSSSSPHQKSNHDTKTTTLKHLKKPNSTFELPTQEDHDSSCTQYIN